MKAWETKIRAIGNSEGTVIPKEMLSQFHMSAGDRVHLVETEDGILVTPYDPTFARAMAIYREGAGDYRNAMRELAE